MSPRKKSAPRLALDDQPARPRTLPLGIEVAHHDEPLRIETVDFSDPNRPKTALEVDFPIGPINRLAQLEINAKKPIYEMGKWWARRQSSVFRALLIAAAAKAPDDDAQAARLVWDAYYANHQAAGNFAGLRVLEPFAGGGTTLIEGSRLGFDMVGVDLNPVAWFVTKTALSGADPQAVERLFDHVERSVRPHVTPFATTECPRGHRGHWFRVESDECPFDLAAARSENWSLQEMPTDFDPHSVPEGERGRYRYEGPEAIYTFWQKHGPCPRCQHRTPVVRRPTLAVKELTVRVVKVTCQSCHARVDWEFDDARMAPGAPLVVAPNEPPFMAPGRAALAAPCPSCGTEIARPSDRLATRKKVALTLLIHPAWLRGTAGVDAQGEMGGWAGAPLDAECRWMRARVADLTLVEVRGALPDSIVDPLQAGAMIDTTRGTATRTVRATRGGGVEEKDDDASFVCGGCGTGHKFLPPVQASRHTAPVFPVAMQGYCPECNSEGRPYGGRFFKIPDHYDLDRWLAAVEAWECVRSGPLARHVPTEALPFAHMTHERTPLIQHGYTHWWKMFNSRQLLTHARVVEAIVEAPSSFGRSEREAALIAFQQYLRKQNMFCFWQAAYDKAEPFFSNNDYHPKASVVEASAFGAVGAGTWRSCSTAVLNGERWARSPWEKAPNPAERGGKSVAVPLSDPVRSLREGTLLCRDSADLKPLANGSVDLVITDPPFGGNVFYSDLADFFYAWLRRPLVRWYPDYFASEHTDKAREAIENTAEHPDRRTLKERRRARETDDESPADAFYRGKLTACWRECHRVLKDGGTLAFTFHHNEDRAWVGVLRSLFDAEFTLVATYPIRSDESKGEGASFGSKKIEYDIIHVCRKRLAAPAPISYVALRRRVRADLTHLRELLKRSQGSLSDADLRVILRGKALEHYSLHYGQVMVGTTGGGERPLDVGEALTAVNDLLGEDAGGEDAKPPTTAEPLTQLYLNLFTAADSMARDDVHKLLRGSGFSPESLDERGWTTERDRLLRVVPIQARFVDLRSRPRVNLRYDLDQAHFLIGAAIEGSGIDIGGELRRGTFALRHSVAEILEWIAEHEPDELLAEAAGRAQRLVGAHLARSAEREPGPGVQIPMPTPVG